MWIQFITQGFNLGWLYGQKTYLSIVFYVLFNSVIITTWNVANNPVAQSHKKTEMNLYCNYPK